MFKKSLLSKRKLLRESKVPRGKVVKVSHVQHGQEVINQATLNILEDDIDSSASKSDIAIDSAAFSLLKTKVFNLKALVGLKVEKTKIRTSDGDFLVVHVNFVTK
jgi:hypothetical protein